MGRVIFIGILLLYCLSLSGCSERHADISIMTSYAATEANFEAYTYARYDESLIEWMKDHPEVKVERKTVHRPDEFRAYACLGANHLPDIFIVDRLTGRLLKENDLVLELTDMIDGKSAILYNEKAYAISVLPISYYVIVYDSDSWSEGDPITCVGDDVVGILSHLLSSDKGQEWLADMLMGKRTGAFTDDYFLSQLALATQIKGGNGGTIQDFIEGKCNAALLNNNQIAYVFGTLRECDPDRYKKLGFAACNNGTIPCGSINGVFLNAKLADDPFKLKKCLDLCMSFAGKEEMPKDDTVARLYEILDKSPKSKILNQEFNFAFWTYAYDRCFNEIGKTDKTVQEYASILQDIYEQSYLGVEDYAKQLDQFIK